MAKPAPDFFTFISRGTGDLSLTNLDYKFPVPIDDPRLPPIIFTITNLSLIGVNTQNSVDVMRPVGNKIEGYPGNYSTKFGINNDILGLAAGGKLDVLGSKIHFNDWHTDWTVSVSVDDIVLSSIVELGISASKILDISIGGKIVFCQPK